MLAELPVLLPGLPFDELTMPRYRGPLILILGGSAMLAVSLFLSLLMQDRRTNLGNPTHPGPLHSYPHHALKNARPERPTAGPAGRTGPDRWQEAPVRPALRKEKPGRPATKAHRRPEPAPQHGARPGHGPRPAQNPAQAGLVTRRARVRKRWLRTMKRTARRAGLGTPEHLVAPGGRHALQLRHCRTCMVSRGHVGCEQERVLLEDALRRHEPRGSVVEVACDPQYGRCRFEILPGGR